MAEAVLCRQLGLRYPHVFHGVGAGGLHDGGLKLLGSGLLVAARYPPLAASFYCYPNGAGEDALAAKGLLCIQVRAEGTGRGAMGRCVGVWLCGCVVVDVCGCVVVWLYCVVVWLCGCVVSLCGCVVVWLCGCVVV